MDLLLGSQSPRRKEILNYFSLPFQTATPSFDEELYPFEEDPSAYVSFLSKGKAESLKDHHPHSLILTADTVVYRSGKVYGKPLTSEQGFEFLKELSNTQHTVYTGLTLGFKDTWFQSVEETQVLFNTLTDDQIKGYQNAVHWPDKAGGYMIQGSGSLIVKRIEGCYYNVMGMPIQALSRLLLKFNIDLWNYLKKE